MNFKKFILDLFNLVIISYFQVMTVTHYSLPGAAKKLLNSIIAALIISKHSVNNHIVL